MDNEYDSLQVVLYRLNQIEDSLESFNATKLSNEIYNVRHKELEARIRLLELKNETDYSHKWSAIVATIAPLVAFGLGIFMGGI